MIDVLEYVRDPALCWETCQRLLRPAGRLVFGHDLAGLDFAADDWFRRGIATGSRWPSSSRTSPTSRS